jgi:hypothetical protein
MGFLEIVAGTEPVPAGVKGINAHGIMCLLGEMSRGRYGAADLMNRMGVAGQLRTEIQQWAQTLGPTKLDPSGNRINREKIHDVLIGLDQGLYTVAEAKRELGI